MIQLNNTIQIIVLILLGTISESVYAQIETTFFREEARDIRKSEAYFFTNRPLQVDENNAYTFKNKFNDNTNTLYFCSYDFETDSIALNFRTVNLSDSFPTGPVKHNFFYEAYNNQRLKRGIKDYYIIVGGYGKSFKKQVHSYMRRLKSSYGDSLFNKITIDVFAWGAEEQAYKYYNAVRKSKYGAADFAIYQHMLDEFMSDEAFWKENPKDISFYIMFSSMGNNLFKEYLEERERQGIPLVKTYERISFVGSVAPRDAFEEGEAFNKLHEMTDSINVFVNSKDVLLKLSSIAHFGGRMGNAGPRRAAELPDYIKIIDVKDIITLKDMTGLGHDYILTNPILQQEILDGIKQSIEE